MPRFNDAAKLGRYLKLALDAVQAETLISTQARLGSAAVSPIDTGRFRSSWFASEGSASNEVAPDNDAKAIGGLRKRQAQGRAEGTGAGSRGIGSNRPQTDAADLRVDNDKTYHLTNNLPYAQEVAIEGHVKRKDPNWFHDFVGVEIPRIQRASTLAVRRQFQL
jgi:hypothetical protein